MNNAGRTSNVLLALVMASALSACAHEEGNVKSAEIQADKESLLAAGGLIHLQESPAFPVDDKKTPFAMMEDRTERARASDKPLRLDEPRKP